jgi:hypothetical protein
MLQPVIQQLSNYFLQPLGLAALAALVPLIIFYLMRPSPEETVMPSMEFFHEDKKSGRLQKALRILQRNLMLILHILMVAGLAAAIANPYIMTDERPDNAVVVIDNSASMKPVFSEVKERAMSELGRTNTVVVANAEAEVALNQVSLSRARSFVKDLQVEETGSSIGRALERARNYRGKMFIASDFDSTGKAVDLDPLLESLSASRPVETFNPEKSNSWGIVDLEISGNNSTVFIQNFRTRPVETEFVVGDDSRNIQLESGELREMSFTLEEGRNTVVLGNDGFEVDNKAYVMKPASEDVRVTVIDDERNRYLMKALELMGEIDARHVTPEEEIPSTDVYIIGRLGSPDELKLQEISSHVKEGKGLILYAQRGLESSGIERWPVASPGEVYNTSVSVSRPVEVELDNVTVLGSDISGGSGSKPGEALKFADMGEGELLYFNFVSQEFRESLMYPVFWRQAIKQVAGKASVSELNRKSGATVLTDERAVELSETGLTQVGQRNYALNLLNGEESSFEEFTGNYDSAETVRRSRSLQTVPVLLLVFFGLAELFYLWRRGEVP